MIPAVELTTTEGKDQFYPTPDELAEKMLAGLDWNMIHTILEPSAGKGNLVKCAIRAKAEHDKYPRPHGRLDIDCIEIDPYLRQILKYNFSDESVSHLRKRYQELDSMYSGNRTASQNNEMQQLRRELDVFDHAHVRIVHDDFLTFRGHKRYDLILMNPPFSDGDKHLLKAIKLQSGGGAIICLLNAETLRNPFTNSRRLLKQQLDRYGANITFVENGFTNAERKTDVSVAIVRINIPVPEYKSTIYERMEKAEPVHIEDQEITDLVVGDFLERMVRFYNVEVEATLEFIREYKALCPYMPQKFNPKECYDSNPILSLVIKHNSSYDMFDVNEYMHEVRLKYWRALFTNQEFTGRLTSNLQDEYRSTVEKMADYEFSLFNIKQVLIEMNSRLVDGVKSTILALFDKLTAEHTWYEETKQNIHYYNGWKTNKAHKIGKKSIIPTHGMFSSYSWSKTTFDVSTAYKVISDIEKVFNYLDGGLTEEVDLLARLKMADAEGRTRNIECKYFKIDLFKKGTTHIKYTNMDLVEKLNIYAARNKGWLPPSYGRAKYSEMTKEEKEVIDSFQGEAEYARIMAMQGYFLSDPTKSMPMLTSGAEQ